MKALKKTSENLDKVIESFTSLYYPKGTFNVSYRDKCSVALCRTNCSGIGCTALRLIPSNWTYRVDVSDVGEIYVLRLFIWLV